MADNSLINFGDLSKPATVLIEKISEAVGGICRPGQIRRVAKAKADAAINTASAEIKITDLHRRAATRWVNEEARKQHNMESITEQAIQLLEQGAQPENLEPDWIADFFEKCRLISNEEMQRLWAKILAGEANVPGTYSKRTVATISALDKSDAELFTRVCGFIWPAIEHPLIYNIEHPIYSQNGITFPVLNHLETIGLLSFNSLSSYSLTDVSQYIQAAYDGAVIFLNLPDPSGNKFPLGQTVLTAVGRQLARIVTPQVVPGFFEYSVQHWANQGYGPASPYPREAVLVT